MSALVGFSALKVPKEQRNVKPGLAAKKILVFKLMQYSLKTL